MNQINAIQLKQLIEASLFVLGKPLSIKGLKETVLADFSVSRTRIQDAIDELQLDYQDRGVQLVKVASGYRFQVVQDVAPWVSRLWDEKPQKYSRALLETLSLIAYRQPITRGDIEDIRGVAVSSHIIKTLTEREWVRVVGHKDVPGRPSLFATTRQFLDYFNLKNLDELPSLAEIRDLDSMNEELALEGADTQAPEVIDQQADDALPDASNADGTVSDGEAAPPLQVVGVEQPDSEDSVAGASQAVLSAVESAPVLERQPDQQLEQPIEQQHEASEAIAASEKPLDDSVDRGESGSDLSA